MLVKKGLKTVLTLFFFYFRYTCFSISAKSVSTVFPLFELLFFVFYRCGQRCHCTLEEDHSFFLARVLSNILLNREISGVWQTTKRLRFTTSPF